MAEELAVAGVEGLVKMLVSLGIDEIGLIRGVKEEVVKLRTFLNHIQLVLEDADKRQVAGDGPVKIWLKELKEAALDAEDLLEEFAYDALRQKVTGERHHKVRKFLSCFTTLKLHSNTAHSIRNINKRLEDIDNKKNTFNFIRETNTTTAPENNNNIVPVAANDRQTTALVDESHVIGRDVEKEEILAKLIHAGSGSSDPGNSSGTTPLWIMAIRGLGGLGKTTLAQLVFKDDSVEEHFGSMKIWVCVSEDFAIPTIWCKILKEIDSNAPESSNKQELQKILEKNLNRKFLLVLDDFWDKDLGKWEELILPLKQYGAPGSKVIVTTRQENVASRAHHIHHLQPLPKDSWYSLFESQAFMQGGPDRTSDLVEIGRKVVEKCGGVPLALKVLGGLMHQKKSKREWLAICNCEIWKTDEVQEKVMKILKLSYNNLPPKVRQCFSYCAIFPKDHWIEKEEVIHLWMAQGFLRTSNQGELMEDIGQEFFNILCMASLLEEHTRKGYYQMHDLVHDLAMMLCGSECKGAGHANDDETNKDVRHISLISSEERLEIPKGIDEVRKLRTFYSFHSGDDSYDPSQVIISLPKLLQLRPLRVLVLRGLPLRELPSSIGGLKLLKYLDLSWSNIEKLPSSIVKLYNLQTFNISYCFQLFELPKCIETLTQLRHFYSYSDNISNYRETSRGLNKLRFLQTLDILKLCSGPESASEHIAELEHLNYLKGTLRIENLGDVNDVKAMEKANLTGKENLHTLHMDWKSVTEGDNGNVSHHTELLEALQPHRNLQWLAVSNFQGLELPCWMSNSSTLPNLVKLELRDCNKCTRIKSLGRLPILKELVIRKMSSLTTIGEGPEEAPILYPCLVKLLVCDVRNLEDWFEDSADIFPLLQELVLLRCPKLINMPSHFPSLQELTIEEVKSDTVSSITENVTSLTSLYFEGSSSYSEKEEEELVARMLGNNKLLKILTVKGLSSMRCLPDLSGLQLLGELYISHCEALKTCPDLSPSLKILYIKNCPALQIESARLPCVVEQLRIDDVKAFVVDDTLWSNKLSFLYIHKVPEFVQQPVDFLRNNMHLRSLSIQSCPQFKGFLSSNEEEIRSSPDSTPPPPSSCCVETLRFIDCPSILGLQLQGFVQLRNLRVVGCKGHQSLEGLQSLRNIQSLSIGRYSEELNDFPFLDAIEMGGHLISSLRYLHIYGWSRLKSLPEQIQHLSRLEDLSIDSFDGMENLPDWLGKLTSLETLKILNCKNLMHLPSANAMRKLTSLRRLQIWSCPLLKERCKPPKKRCGLCSGSSEWHKISHISKVDLGSESSDSKDENNSSYLSRLVKKMRSNVC